ncbi:glycerophosphodiester phosphodiesterase family protein, partial [Streptomyces sp. NPDC059082]|uniref:glycerophosphodiester phosphodiesterase family protein n=1 Tax=Streptomyces sp. NPDC059082 TaxID=3346720 RepID=UPI0036B5C9B1
MRPVTVVGHRGDPYRVRENTLPSNASAIVRGADPLEIDDRLPDDGVPDLHHHD